MRGHQKISGSILLSGGPNYFFEVFFVFKVIFISEVTFIFEVFFIFEVVFILEVNQWLLLKYLQKLTVTDRQRTEGRKKPLIGARATTLPKNEESMTELSPTFFST